MATGGELWRGGSSGGEEVAQGGGQASRLRLAGNGGEHEQQSQ